MSWHPPLRRSVLAALLSPCFLNLGCAAAPPGEAGDALHLPRIFQDGMVLQRDAPLPVWGWAAPGAAVTVTLAGHTAAGAADARGQWRVEMPALPPGGPHTLTAVAAADTVVIGDVLIGDVWVASGQSNMEWPLSLSTGAEAAIAAADDPLLREFTVPRAWSESPEPDVAGGRWVAAGPESAGGFSAVAYFFARELRRSTGVPIGVVHASWGGSAVETWISRDAHGFVAGEWDALMRHERERESQIQAGLRARIGDDLPAEDGGLVDGVALWADPDLDDDGWDQLPVPALWEEVGYAGLDGVAWYRTRFTLSDDEASRGARLSLGMIDDDDITWVNGVEVGRTTGYSVRRSYAVAAEVLRPGRNVIAVRVVDGGGGGGPHGEPEAFHLDLGSRRLPLAGTWRFRVGAVRVTPDGQRINKLPALLHHAMIHPLLDYAIRGVIWYQGESNANSDAQAAEYGTLFPRLIRSWRAEWRGSAGDFPFLWVQLPGFGPLDSVPPDRAAWATLRESQTAALALPATGQVVAIDLGDPDDIHPRDKAPVGERLALVARRVAYAEPVVASGPTYRGHEIRDGRVVLEFEHVGAGLVAVSPPHALGTASPTDGPGGFAVADADRRWVWAEARIEGDRVVVWSPRVPEPVAVRYAWSNSPPAAGLFNREGLPARPFRTDDW